MSRFEGQFYLTDPKIGCTSVPRFPESDYYKIVVFDVAQAEAIFIQGIHPNNIRVYAIREKDMVVKVIESLVQAVEFFES